MNEFQIQTQWLIDGRLSLLRLREEIWLTEPERAVIDRGIVALSQLSQPVAEMTR
jgi:hypothetical protein